MTDALLVPIAVEGLVVNAHVSAESNFLRWHIDYRNIESLLDPLPAPWQNKERNPPEIGVHLRWTLPRALKHGETNRETQTVDFPKIPNRWLIVRLGAATPAGSATPRPAKAWIVESDYVGANGSNSFAVKSGDSVVFTKIGLCYELGAAPTLFHSSASTGFLTAVGAGDVSFTAYQPDMQNVLSFHDPAKDVAEGTKLTYLVAGWFANLADDPVKKYKDADGTEKDITTIAQLQQKLDALRWSVQLGSTLPPRTVVHGMLQEVTWQTAKMPDRADPTAQGMSVAVGHTAIDALAALVATRAAKKKHPDPARLEQRLQAFQYDMFDVLDEHGGAALEVNLRRGWFSQTPGGTMWSLVPRPNDDPSAQTPVPTDAQKQWVAALNRRQQQRDDATRLLRSLQAELYELWWKNARIDAMSDDDKVTQSLPPLKIKIDDLQDRIADLLKAGNPDGILKRVQNQIAAVKAFDDLPDPASKTAIENYEKTMPAPASFHLKPATEPPFEAPVDPVVLLAGVTSPPGLVDAGQKIACRLVAQTVTGVTSGGTAFTASTGQISKALPVIDLTKLPSDLRDAVSALMVETFFVDPQDAPAIGWCGAGWNDSSALAAAMRNRTAQTASIAAPLAAAFAFAPWAQAWSPLYLAWEVQWYAQLGEPTGPPDKTDWRGPGKDTIALDMNAWSFDGRDDVRARGSEYFRWAADKPPAPQLTYTGRSLLTPQATLLFIDRLKNHVKTHPDADLKKIEELIDEVGAARFLSQSLTLNQKLIARRHQHSRTPADIAALIGGENQTVPDTAVGDQRPYIDANTRSFFFPVRGGYFTIERLVLVDVFGQFVDLIEANDNAGGTTQTFYPIRGQGLVPDPAVQVERPLRYMKQAPRVVQPSRARMRLIDASNDAWDLGLQETANPVCGWLVHNFLDRSLAFYSPDGIAIGDLVLTGTTAQPDVTWIPAPLTRDAGGAIVQPPPLNAHAQAFRDQLLARSDRGAAFLALLAIIDQRIGTIDYGSDTGDPDLAVLIGRPLALIRARVELQILGLPTANASWRSTPVSATGKPAKWDMAARQTANFTSIPVSIRLGTEELKDDGVIGYFDQGETIFNSVRTPQPEVPYIRPIGSNGNYVKLQFAGDTNRFLTLLVDPRANVHATTGILPTASLSVPAEFVDAPLKRMAFTFRTGPVLSTREAVRVPPPAEHHGTWMWMRKTTTAAADPCATQSIVQADEKPLLTERPRALDGWLKFTPTKK